MSIRLALAFCLLALHDVQGMQCSRKQTSKDEGWLVNKLEDILVNCPRPLIDDDSKSFCCYSSDFHQFECCDFSSFMFSPLVLFWITIGFIVVIAILAIYCAIKFFGLILDMCCGIVNYLHRKL